METREKVLRIEPAEWSEGAARLLADAVTAESLPIIARQVQAGAAHLFAITQAGEVACLIVLRVDRDDLGAEGVVVAASGGAAGVDITAVCLPEIEKMFSGVRAIRIHTMRPGLVKKLARQGYEGAEIVMRKRVAQ